MFGSDSLPRASVAARRLPRNKTSALTPTTTSYSAIGFHRSNWAPSTLDSVHIARLRATPTMGGISDPKRNQRGNSMPRQDQHRGEDRHGSQAGHG